MAAGYSWKQKLSRKDIDGCVHDLVNLIDRKYISGAFISHPMGSAKQIQYFTSEIMSKISFDADFHDLRHDNDNFR